MSTTAKPTLIATKDWGGLGLAFIAHGAILGDGWSRQLHPDGKTFGLKNIDGVTYKAETYWYLDDEGITTTTDMDNAKYLGFLVTASTCSTNSDSVGAKLQQSLVAQMLHLMTPGVPHPDINPHGSVDVEEIEGEESW
jgi:hypothetical protein